MTGVSWEDDGVAALDPLCRAVGLAPVEIATTSPVGARLWTADYAALLFWVGTADSLRDATVAGEAWLAEYLAKEEQCRGARVVDGYLLVALPQPAKDDDAALVRAIELSTQICRKHVIWPEDNGAWLRIDEVTVLGLPPGVTSASGEPAWPSLTAEAASLWAAIQRLGAVRAAAAEAARP